ncbi:MAG TPA: SPFH domain-containing protein [Polyangiaceae bacterium]|jgi:flotillin|nr:MAG: SPFH domain / Band 7 family protein [Deltaproteobacteria bacterium ADurb.Bin207]HNS96114.1 SPFH domain-containing protein [Polyangiaceae bacterium]HNZ22149.1 SPFH domain-containing protein [Polyangiaceae bacterium]HOD21355.1 SPFH domain-containing protein [Polyangiaceae bacterium]HOE46973.1 SPFH domain-containing protein [Polyangiaceae bacterium]
MMESSGVEGAALSAIVLGASVFTLILLGAMLLIIQRLLLICPPNKVLIFSGRKHKLPDGSVVGYRVLHGGRGIRIPLLETVSELDMRIFPVQVTVQNAFSKGGIPLAVQAIANVKISSDPRFLRSAAERFLDVPVQRLAEVAKDTLEGALREVLAELTPEEVNQDRLKFADKLLSNAGDDFERLGLQLDVLKIQHVSDEQGYLTNLGREAIANMLRDAENAENAANQTIAEAQAAARTRAETALKNAEAQVLKKKNEYQTQLAKLEAEAASAENEATVDAETARSMAEQNLQEMRKQYEQLRLACDVVLPAQAKRRAEELLARGEASPFIETGKARAIALQAVVAEWTAAGLQGREIYVLNHLKELVEAAVQRTASTQIKEINVVDGGDAASYGSFVAAFPQVVSQIMQETGQAVGVDLGAMLQSRKAGG